VCCVCVCGQALLCFFLIDSILSRQIIDKVVIEPQQSRDKAARKPRRVLVFCYISTFPMCAYISDKFDMSDNALLNQKVNNAIKQERLCFVFSPSSRSGLCSSSSTPSLPACYKLINLCLSSWPRSLCVGAQVDTESKVRERFLKAVSSYFNFKS